MTERTCHHDNDQAECDACFVAFEIPKRTTCPHGNDPSECVPCFEGPAGKPDNVYPIRPEED